MNCYLHPETPAAGYCRSCGRPLCALCQRTVDGVIYCQDHVPVPVYAAPPPSPGAGAGPANPYPAANPYGAPPPPAAPLLGVNTSPVVAFLLGWIPGVGAIYNGQYLKGLVHAVIFGLLISLAQSSEGSASQPFIIMTMVGFIFYMPFEAFHTAKKRQLGLPVDEWSSLTGSRSFRSRAPIGPIVLIAIGVLFLLDTLHLLEFREFGRYWPVLLIVVGVWMLYGRMSGLRSHPSDQGNYSSTPPPPGADPAVGVSREQ
ncbi:MAG: B-box zinc finger protein [Acidobacteriaceae bacterium]|nr:B-box zinc finger protein [Acidobacteriaceae bacterium]